MRAHVHMGRVTARLDASQGLCAKNGNHGGLDCSLSYFQRIKNSEAHTSLPSTFKLIFFNDINNTRLALQLVVTVRRSLVEMT